MLKFLDEQAYGCGILNGPRDPTRDGWMKEFIKRK